MAAAFILFAAAASLYGRGGREGTPLAQADVLIAAKEYDQALAILTDYMKDNPENFNDAQKRLQKIIKLREQYNVVANELLDTLENEPENDVKILGLIDVLLTIESPSNPATVRFLDQVRHLAEMNVNRNRLDDIFLLARSQLSANDFSGAIDTYASGLDIYQDEYFEAGYGQEAEDVASDGLQNIALGIQAFKALMSSISRDAQALVELCEEERPQVDLLRSGFTTLMPIVADLAVIRDGFYNIRSSYDAQLALLQAEDNVVGDRSFLSFAGRLLTGPAGHNEGMTGVIGQFRNFSVNQAEEALINLVERSFSRGYWAIVSWDYSRALPSLTDTSNYISIALELIKSGSSFYETGGSEMHVIYGESVSGVAAGKYLRLRSMDSAVKYLTEAGNLGNRDPLLVSGGSSAFNSWQNGVMGAPAAIAAEQNLRRSYQEMFNELSAIDRRIETEMEAFVSYQKNLSDSPDAAGSTGAYLTDTRSVISSLASRLRNQALTSAIHVYTIANSDLEKNVNEREAEFNEGNRLVRGVPMTLDGEAHTAYYPSEGFEVLTRMNQALGTNITGARALVAQYAAESREMLDAAEVNRLYASARALLDRLLNLQPRSAALIATARSQAERAASLRYEGDRLLQTAQAAMNRNDLNAARTNLTRAAEQYDASLAVQESTSLRTIRDTNLVRMGADIVRIENEIVVRDVRDMLNTARSRYFAGNMDQAEELLLRAQSRWRTTNVTEQQEVEYWLGLVRGAMSLQSGRTIAPTAPLYAEMSQLLSDARRNYDEGVMLLNAGRRNEGLFKFKEAMAKTREVRLMFPMNHDARMLELRIEQQTDQAAFTAAFRQRLDEAVAGTKARNQQSFADLQDLAEINSRYPGIQNLLTQAEIDMGFRPPPPDPRNLARSTELTRGAEANINSRDSNRYVIAQTQLEEAIRLNPNNNQAQTLLDQVSVLMTGSGRFVIPTSVMERYNEAVQMYNQGNYLRANAIVQQLLQNPENQRSTQIMELKRRIDAVL